MPGPWHYLRDLLLETRRHRADHGLRQEPAPDLSADVLARIKSGDPSWEPMVPPSVAETIKAKRLFGLAPAAAR